MSGSTNTNLEGADYSFREHCAARELEDLLYCNNPSIVPVVDASAVKSVFFKAKSDNSHTPEITKFQRLMERHLTSLAQQAMGSVTEWRDNMTRE